MRKATAVALTLGFMAASTAFALGGFAVNAARFTVGHDDPVCDTDPDGSRPPNCFKACTTAGAWWVWGRDRDCAWRPRAEAPLAVQETIHGKCEPEGDA